MKLADEIRQRQASFATRGFGRRNRPALHSEPSVQLSTSHDDAGPSDSARDASHELGSESPQQQSVTLADDDDEEAGQLEMDYAPDEEPSPTLADDSQAPERPDGQSQTKTTGHHWQPRFWLPQPPRMPSRPRNARTAGDPTRSDVPKAAPLPAAPARARSTRHLPLQRPDANGRRSAGLNLRPGPATMMR